jgi:phosphoenolpyruvate carboxykinase (ATP)
MATSLSASVRPSSSPAEPSMRKCSDGEFASTSANAGWSTLAGSEGSTVSGNEFLSYTRALIKAALSGLATRSMFETERVFRLAIPKDWPDVPSKLLHPRQNWSDKRAYDKTAVALMTRFRENAAAVGIPRTFWGGGPVFDFGG